MQGQQGGRRALKGIGAALCSALVANNAGAFQFETDPDWKVYLDNSVQYTTGWRIQQREDAIGNHPFYHQGDYKFDRGDMVTNRLQDLIEFQAVYKDKYGVRVSGSVWKDWAYDNDAETNPALSALNVYPSGRYSSHTKRYHIQGGEWLDAFAFANGTVGDVPTSVKVGRFTQQWGNAFFFGFSNIAYSQHPTDFIKGFSQPGSEVKELFLPRNQVMVSASLTPELAVSGQYFFEFDGNRFPEGGTYLSAADFLYKGPQSVPALAGAFGIAGVSAGNEDKPDNNNDNFGVKLTWSPEWAEGDLGFYYRKFDEVHPWALLDLPATAAGTGRVHLTYPDKVELFGLSYERAFGLLSTGWELSYRKNSGLQSALTNGLAGVPTASGATGDITNLIVNGMLQSSATPLFDSSVTIAEFSYTHLNKVTGNRSLYSGKGTAACQGGKAAGCATDNALAFAVLFIPQWSQVFPSVDLELPISYTWGVRGNPAYTAGGFYAEDSKLFSIGLKATYKSKHTAELRYAEYYWNPGHKVAGPAGEMYGSGNGAIALNDRGWVSLVLKSSF